MWELEKIHIQLWGRKIDGGVLLNETLGGEGKPGGLKSIGFTGRKHTEESKRKISEKTRGENNPRWGLRFSPEERKKFHNKRDNKGKENPNSKSFRFTNKSGESFIITGEFKKFCEEKGIKFPTMRMRIEKGITHFGRGEWKVERI